jgi:hypothetical protein
MAARFSGQDADMTDATATTLLSNEAWSRLATAHADYHANVSPHYDEVLHEVSDRIQTSGSIGKLDVGALLFWKRLRANTPRAACGRGPQRLRGERPADRVTARGTRAPA